MLLSCRKLKPFTISAIKYIDIIDYKNWWPQYYKKTNQSCDERRHKFTISKYMQFIYDSCTPGYVITYDYINGFVSHTFKLLKAGTTLVLQTAPAYSNILPINIKKIENL